MQILEIKISELSDFVTSKIWQQISPKPITALRAISQAQNPRAAPDDVALIIACENETLLGLVGLLPDLIHGNPEQKIFSNSCWWAHPEKGRHLAVPLFLKAFSVCNQRMFMTDCTPHTLNILEKINLFDFPETKSGVRGFLKFNLHEILPAKIPATKKIEFLLKGTDQILNLITGLYRKMSSGKFLKNDLRLEIIDSFSSELVSFIEKQSENEFTRRTATDLKWIRLFPWIKPASNDQYFSTVEYPFSYLVDDFNQKVLKISDQNGLIGILLMTIRDGHLKIPYAYFEDNKATALLQVIYQYALQNDVTTLTVFNSRLVESINSGNHPFLFLKKIRRMLAISKQLSADYHKYSEFQDGDGDVVFT